MICDDKEAECSPYIPNVCQNVRAAHIMLNYPKNWGRGAINLLFPHLEKLGGGDVPISFGLNSYFLSMISPGKQTH